MSTRYLRSAAILCTFTSLASGQLDREDRGTLALSFSPEAVLSSVRVQPWQPFEFYLLATLDAGEAVLRSYEGALLLDSSIAFMDAEYYPPTMFNSGLRLENGRFDFQVMSDTTPCAPAADGFTVLAKFTALVTLPSDGVFIGIDAYGQNPSGFGPVWASCASVIYDFLVLGEPASQLAVIFSSVDQADFSWGALKAQFR